MNKYIPTEREGNKPCQNKECPKWTDYQRHNCGAMFKDMMHNCKGYQPEQEEKINE